MMKLALLTVGVSVFSGMAIAQESTTLKGTVSYREKMALPANAFVSVKLEEIGPSDAPSRIVSETGYRTGGKNVPLPFQLTWMPGSVNVQHRYYLSATISVGKKVMFRSARSLHIIPGQPSEPNLVLQRDQTPAPTPTLQNTRWILLDINGKPIKTDGRSPEITLKNGNLGSNTGVNTLGGSYKVTGNSLQIRPGMQTMVAGSDDAMKLERSFIAMLGKVTTWKISGQTLELRNGKAIVAKLTASQ